MTESYPNCKIRKKQPPADIRRRRIQRNKITVYYHIQYDTPLHALSGGGAIRVHF